MPSIITLNAVTNSSDLQNNTQLTNRTVYASALRDWVKSSSFGGNFANNSIPSNSLQQIPGSKIDTATLSGSNFNGPIARLSITDNDIAIGTITVQKINATGTRSSTTFLRGDGVWANVTSPAAGSGISVSTANNTSTISTIYATQTEVEGTTPPTNKSVSAKVLADVLGGGAVSGGYVTLTTNQTIGGTKTITNALILSTQASATSHAVRADRTILPGDGLSGGGNLTANISLGVDSTVVRTSGNQTITGSKTFSSIILGDINGNAGSVTNGIYTTGNHTKNGTLTVTGLFTGGGTTPAVGRVNLRSGTSAQAGYVEIRKADDTRLGYMGWNNSQINIECEGSNNNLRVGGGIQCTGNITAFFSDERLKSFEGKIENALEKVSSLNGYYYKENDKARSLGFNNDKVQIGVRAQEVEKVFPELVTLAPIDISYNEEGEEVSKSGENIKTVYYEKLVPVLIEAIKELNSKVKELELKLNS